MSGMRIGGLVLAASLGAVAGVAIIKGIEEQIGKKSTRQRAQISLIYRISRDDPGEARRMLEEMDLPEEMRQGVERNLQRGVPVIFR